MNLKIKELNLKTQMDMTLVSETEITRLKSENLKLTVKLLKLELKHNLSITKDDNLKNALVTLLKLTDEITKSM